MRSLRSWLGVSAALVTAALFAGCASSPSTSTGADYRFDPLAQSSSGNAGTGAPSSTAQTPDSRPGLSTSDAGGDHSVSGRVLRVGDGFTVTFQDLGPVGQIPPVDTTIKEDGTITLIYNKTFHADGKTVGQLESEIRKAYVPDMFVNMTPTISTKDRWYYVDGEVKGPGRQVYLNHMTVVDAIATVGGFTDFARKHKVQLIRANGKSYYVDYTAALRKPELNLEVFPDDRVIVKKRWW